MKRSFGLRLLLLGLGAGLLLLPAAPAEAKLDSKAWRAAQAEFERLFAARGEGEKKRAVLATIASDGTARAWKLLGRAFPVQVERLQAIRTEYAQAATVHGDILLGALKGYSLAQEARAKEQQQRMRGLEEVEREEALVLDALVGIHVEASASARRAILKLAKPKAPWTLRASVARVAARSLADRGALGHLRKVLQAEPDDRVRAAALDALSTLASLPDDARPLLLSCLEDTGPEVVHRAADVVRLHPFAAAGTPLQAAWAGASWHVRRSLAGAIEALLADEAAAAANAELRTWWASTRKAAPEARVARVPLAGDGVLFLVDVSTYTKAAVKDVPWKLVPAGEAGADKGPSTAPALLEGTLLDGIKNELHLAIRKLPATVHFNLLAFNHGAGLWASSMKLATQENKDLARKWLRGLASSGASYVEGALRLSLGLAGAFAYGEDVRMPEIDTLVVLSAGKTTNNAFPTHGAVEPAGILEHARMWNRTRGLVIHTVCFGESAFLRDLAAQHAGTYAHR